LESPGKPEAIECFGRPEMLAIRHAAAKPCFLNSASTCATTMFSVIELTLRRNNKKRAAWLD
jgi:hypothetical protein